MTPVERKLPRIDHTPALVPARVMMQAAANQKEATMMLTSETEDWRETVEIRIREMFMELRTAVKGRQRYLVRKAEVLNDLKRERLTAEFEDLYEQSEIVDSCTPEESAELDKDEMIYVTAHRPAKIHIDDDIKDAISEFGRVAISKQQSLGSFIIASCAVADPVLIAEGLALLAKAPADSEKPAISIDEVEGVVEVLQEYTSAIVLSDGFAAPHMIRDASAGLALAAQLTGEDDHAEDGSHTHGFAVAIGKDGGVNMFLEWLKATLEDEHSVSPVCHVLAEVCKDPANMTTFLQSDGLADIVAVLSTPGSFPERLENAMLMIGTMAASHDPIAHAKVLEAEITALVIQVLSSHKTSNSSTVHVRAANALVFLLYNEDSALEHRQIMVANGIVPALLACLMPRVTDIESAQAIGTLLITLLQTAGATDTVGPSIIEKGLTKIQFILSEFSEDPGVVSVYLQLVAALCHENSAHKIAIMQFELIEVVVGAMLDHKKDIHVQKEACRTLCEISRGEEAVKDYMADVLEDSFYFGFNLIEIIMEALSEFVEDLNFVEAACSASWSVAFKNGKMKTKAAEAGVFEILSKVIEVHKEHPEALTHCFAAISNLVANHAPNQLAAGTGGVIEAAIECLDYYKEEGMMCLTLVTCLKSVMVNQSDNLDKYEENGGVELVSYAHEVFQQMEGELADRLNKTASEVISMTEMRNKEVTALNAKSDAGKISSVEFQEKQDHPLKALPEPEKTEVVKKGMLMMKHKGEKVAKLHLFILNKHALEVYEDPETSKSMTPVLTFHLGLASSVQVEGTNSVKVEFAAKSLGVLTFDAFTDMDAKAWSDTISELLPLKSIPAAAVDSKKKANNRFITVQNEVFFIFDSKQTTVSRAFMLYNISAVEQSGKEFTFTEASHENVWTFAFKDAKDAAEWGAFISEQAQASSDKTNSKWAADEGKAAAKAEHDAAAELARNKKIAEEGWMDEEADRRLLTMMAEDDNLEEWDKYAEIERMEAEAQRNSDSRDLENAARAEREAERMRKIEEKEAAKESMQDLSAYIEALKREIAETREEIDVLVEQNAPLKAELDEATDQADSIYEDYVDMKKELNKVVGGRLGALLGDISDFDSMEKGKASMLLDVEAEKEAEKAERANLVKSAGAANAIASKASLRQRYVE